MGAVARTCRGYNCASSWTSRPSLTSRTSSSSWTSWPYLFNKPISSSSSTYSANKPSYILNFPSFIHFPSKLTKPNYMEHTPNNSPVNDPSEIQPNDPYDIPSSGPSDIPSTDLYDNHPNDPYNRPQSHTHEIPPSDTYEISPSDPYDNHPNDPYNSPQIDTYEIPHSDTYEIPPSDTYEIPPSAPSDPDDPYDIPTKFDTTNYYDLVNNPEKHKLPKPMNEKSTSYQPNSRVHPKTSFYYDLIKQKDHAGCSCSDFTNENGFGKCKKGHSTFGGSSICYVNLPSSCLDLIQSKTHSGRYLSADACQIR